MSALPLERKPSSMRRVEERNDSFHRRQLAMRRAAFSPVDTSGSKLSGPSKQSEEDLARSIVEKLAAGEDKASVQKSITKFFKDTVPGLSKPEDSKFNSDSDSFATSGAASSAPSNPAPANPEGQGSGEQQRNLAGKHSRTQDKIARL